MRGRCPEGASTKRAKGKERLAQLGWSGQGKARQSTTQLARPAGLRCGRRDPGLDEGIFQKVKRKQPP